MDKSSKIKSFADAIEHLETASHAKADEFKKKFEDLKPHFDEFKDKIGHEAKEAKNKAENKVKDHPWMALGAIGLIAFVVGWLLGNSRKD